MSASAPLDRLREVLDERGFVEHEPIDVDGVAPRVTLSPSDGDALARVLAALGEHGLAAIVRGGGTRLGVGNPPARADALVSTDRLTGIVEFDRSDGVCLLAAGTRLDRAREEIRAGGWELPLDPPGERATAGGCVAAAAHGPRALGYGMPRDVLLGLGVSLASGERIRCGGRVVKNVTGYDLNKLFTGSYGTLGVIESLWLRLRPPPERVEICERQFDELTDASRVAIEAARRPASRVSALASNGRAGFRLVVEWAGEAHAVAADVAWFGDRAGGGASDPDAVDTVRDLQHALCGPGGLGFRIGVLPARLGPALESLRSAGAQVLAYPGLNLVYAGFALADATEARVDEVFAQVDRIATGSGGEYLCESAPRRAKRGRDMFGARAELIPIYRELKRQFDPKAVLNAGRSAGGI